MKLEKTPECPLDSKEINSEYFIGKTDAEVKATIIWLPDANSQLFRKDPDAGKD